MLGRYELRPANQVPECDQVAHEKEDAPDGETPEARAARLDRERIGNMMKEHRFGPRYEPDQFPGLVYRLDDPKVVVLLFGSGKLVCTGARKPEDAERAVDKITEELQALGLL